MLSNGHGKYLNRLEGVEDPRLQILEQCVIFTPEHLRVRPHGQQLSLRASCPVSSGFDVIWTQLKLNTAIYPTRLPPTVPCKAKIKIYMASSPGRGFGRLKCVGVHKMQQQPESQVVIYIRSLPPCSFRARGSLAVAAGPI